MKLARIALPVSLLVLSTTLILSSAPASSSKRAAHDPRPLSLAIETTVGEEEKAEAHRQAVERWEAAVRWNAAVEENKRKEREAAEKAAAEAAAARRRAQERATRSRPAPSPGSNRALGQSMASERDWTGEQWNCLDDLWGPLESNWNQYADNPNSSAYGIPQALPGSKMGPGWQHDPVVQVRWGLGYIAGRYGTPCKAKAARLAKGWY